MLTSAAVDDSSKEQLEGDLETAKDLGEIVIFVYRAKLKRKESMEKTRNDIKKAEQWSVCALEENVLKGKYLTHGITHDGSGEGFTKSLSAHTQIKFIDGKKNPFAVFVFRYRSRAALEAALIIDEFEDMPPEEVKRRARKLARERNESQNAHIKPEIKAEHGIKRERQDHGYDGTPIDLTAERAKRPRVEIDLTDD